MSRMRRQDIMTHITGARGGLISMQHVEKLTIGSRLAKVKDSMRHKLYTPSSPLGFRYRESLKPVPWTRDRGGHRNTMKERLGRSPPETRRLTGQENQRFGRERKKRPPKGPEIFVQGEGELTEVDSLILGEPKHGEDVCGITGKSYSDEIGHGRGEGNTRVERAANLDSFGGVGGEQKAVGKTKPPDNSGQPPAYIGWPLMSPRNVQGDGAMNASLDRGASDSIGRWIFADAADGWMTSSTSPSQTHRQSHIPMSTILDDSQDARIVGEMMPSYIGKRVRVVGEILSVVANGKESAIIRGADGIEIEILLGEEMYVNERIVEVVGMVQTATSLKLSKYKCMGDDLDLLIVVDKT
ncbi:hypothetical protein SISSUDRAFT_1038028, partial [Sistotremastrum suecicum HHB10207 ss-3]